MKKKMLILMGALLALAPLASCTPGGETVNHAQGITDTTVKVGNTAAVSGAFAGVGVPFNAGMEAAFKKYNDDSANKRKIEFVTYDDTFDATLGTNYTKKLYEEDKIFSLVGHFGTPTVGATLEFIKDTGLPMIYAATGINALYADADPLSPVMAVQPIYKTDGRIMTARLLSEKIYGGTKDQVFPTSGKIGVLHTSSDDGVSILEGIRAEAEFQKIPATNVLVHQISADNAAAINTAVQTLKTAGVTAIVIASNQAPFKASLASLQSNGLNVPVFTSYTNADLTAGFDSEVNYDFDIFTNAWLDITTASGLADYLEFADCITDFGKPDYAVNSFAMAGYVAAAVFIEGLQRVATVPTNLITWKLFTFGMEVSPINIPMGGTVNFGHGQRIGIDSMSLSKYDNATHTLVKVHDIQSLPEIRG